MSGYIDAYRDEINAGIKSALGQLNGSDTVTVSLMTGVSGEELDDLGGPPAEHPAAPGSTSRP